jgi:DNA-binding NarL/FixJ family response regulator
LNENHPRTRIFIGDSDADYRRRLVEALSATGAFELVGETDSDHAAIEQMRRLEPEMALLELSAPQFDGIRLIEAAVEHRLTMCAILMFDVPPGGDVIHDALNAGARGVISKRMDAAAMLQAVGAVRSEQNERNQADRRCLTERELDVLRLTAEGFSAEDVANKLALSPATIKTYLSRIYSKLGASNKAAAVASAIRNGWLQSAVAFVLLEPPEL